ncbi:hypothetical protein L1887_47918 [Cichorium endivia]|nr:hypothetical protein L1887_47918 [Cichorium endivia]
MLEQLGRCCSQSDHAGWLPVFLDEEMRWSGSDLRGVHVSVSLTDLSGDDGEQGRDNDLAGECIAAALLLIHPTASRHESRRRMALSLPGLHFRNRPARLESASRRALALPSLPYVDPRSAPRPTSSIPARRAPLSSSARPFVARGELCTLHQAAIPSHPSHNSHRDVHRPRRNAAFYHCTCRRRTLTAPTRTEARHHS